MVAIIQFKDSSSLMTIMRKISKKSQVKMWIWKVFVTYSPEIRNVSEEHGYPIDRSPIDEEISYNYQNHPNTYCYEGAEGETVQIIRRGAHARKSP